MTTRTDQAIALTLWRDHDHDVLDLPGIAMGVRVPAAGPDEPDTAAVVSGLYHDGVRRVAFHQPITLVPGADPATIMRAMVLVRELTSWGIVVDWELCVGDNPDVWLRLNHLYPPTAIPDHPEQAAVLAEWRDTFYLCKCVHRKGPGFVQVRDRRAGDLARFTIDDPGYLAALDTLLDGAPAADVPPEILRAFVDEGLAGVAGDLAWWIPYRVRRWPWPSLVV
jgi:hypothetical protein